MGDLLAVELELKVGYPAGHFNPIVLDVFEPRSDHDFASLNFRFRDSPDPNSESVIEIGCNFGHRAVKKRMFVRFESVNCFSSFANFFTNRLLCQNIKHGRRRVFDWLFFLLNLYSLVLNFRLLFYFCSDDWFFTAHSDGFSVGRMMKETREEPDLRWNLLQNS